MFSNRAQNLALTLTMSAAVLPTILGCAGKEDAERLALVQETAVTRTLDDLHDDLEGSRAEVASPEQFLLEREAETELGRQISQGYALVKEAEVLLRTRVKLYTGPRGYIQTSGLYHRDTEADRARIDSGLTELRRGLRAALNDPDQADHRWHLHPLFVKTGAVELLIENGEFGDGRPKAGRASVDGTTTFCYEFYGCAKISLDQIEGDLAR